MASNKIFVQGGRLIKLSCSPEVPENSEVMVRHMGAKRRLGVERIPIKRGSSSVELRTHPDATRIVCSVTCAGSPVRGLSLDADVGEPFGSIPRHFIVIGAMKAGTTSLFAHLSQHPSICVSRVTPPRGSRKESNYFLNEYDRDSSARHYDWRFPFDPSNHVYTLDASPNYTKWPISKAVASRISKYPADVKLAYIMRNPVDRIESHLAHNIAKGRIDTSDIDKIDLSRYVNASRYYFQIEKYLKHVPIERIILLDFDELSKRPQHSLDKVCDFLGISRIPVESQWRNSRTVDFRLSEEVREALAKTLRPDVEALIEKLGFHPAETWGIN